MELGLGEKILKLRDEGLSYRQIEVRLGCSKGTISYHCGSGQKGKTLARTRKKRLCPLRTKMEAFKHGKIKENKDPFAEVIGSKKQILLDKIRTFSRVGTKAKKMGYKFMFKLKDLIEKIGDDPRCYWTGRKINLKSRRSYHLDHLIPKSRGGDNSLENCVLACREANQGHGDGLPKEFVGLSCEVAVHRGKEMLAKMLAHDKNFRELFIAELAAHKKVTDPVCQ
jgi:5-methylcytosine-specific restriction endonuclease McrA